jgi:hypothetical protein
MVDSTALFHEAEVLSRYLIGEAPPQAQIDLYTRAIDRLEITQPEGTFAAAIKHPRLLPYLDAHDALFHSSSQLRQKLYLMFAILETSPELADYFLPQNHSFLYLAVIGYNGVTAVGRLLIGTILVKSGVGK